MFDRRNTLIFCFAKLENEMGLPFLSDVWTYDSLKDMGRGKRENMSR